MKHIISLVLLIACSVVYAQKRSTRDAGILRHTDLINRWIILKESSSEFRFQTMTMLLKLRSN